VVDSVSNRNEKQDPSGEIKDSLTACMESMYTSTSHNPVASVAFTLRGVKHHIF
jgi:hypothetical protein